MTGGEITESIGGSERQPLFAVAIRYDTPDLAIEAPEGGVGFIHRNGVKVALGYNAEGKPVALTESDHDDVDRLKLLIDANLQGYPEDDDPELVSFIEELRLRHRTAAADIVGVTRWALDRPGGYRAILNRRNALFLVNGESEPRILPMRPSAPLLSIHGRTDIKEEWRQVIQTFAGAEWEEPLGHLVARDAKEQIDVSPRAAIVLAWTALETGLKQQLNRIPVQGHTSVTPGDAWEGGRHAVGGELADLIRKVYRRRPDRWIVIPGWAARRLEATRLARVGVVHQGLAPPTRADLVAMVRLARDILYLLDYQAGHDWARTYVSYATGDSQVVIGQPIFVGEMRLE